MAPDRLTVGVDYIGIAVSFYCHDGLGNFVMHKRSQKCRDERGHWEAGGGKLEFGEEPLQAALREIKEEYGCEGRVDLNLPALSVMREENGVKSHWITLGFIVRVNPKEVKINDPESMDEIGWYKLNNLPQPLHTGMALRFKKHLNLFDPFI